MNDVPFAIETTDLRKSFGDTLAVDGIDLRIPRGSVYGLLGPNSAGKTTIRMLATLLRPDSGTATVLGHDVVGEATAVRSKVSLTGQYASVDEDLTGRENLVLAALAQTGPIPLGELADVLGLEYTALTRSANLMEEDGLVASALVVAVFAPLSLRKYRAER